MARKRIEKVEGHEVVVEFGVVNEQIVLGAIIAGWATIGERLLNALPHDFFLAESHSRIVQVLAQMKRRKLGWDMATAMSLGGEGFDVELLAEIIESRPEVPENLDFHVDRMLWDRCRATTLQGPLTALLDSLKDPASDPEQVAALSEQVRTSLRSGTKRRHLRDSKALAREQAVEIAKRAQGIACYPYGLDGLDYYESVDAASNAGVPNAERLADDRGRVRRVAPGCAPGLITFITAMPGSCKSTLAARISLGLARQKRKVLYGAWEPDSKMTLELLAIMSLGYSRSAFLQGIFTTEEHRNVSQRMEAIGEWVQFLDNPFVDRDAAKPTNESNIDLLMSYIADSGCEVAVCDLWQYCLVTDQPSDESRALKYQQTRLKESRVHGILLHQNKHKDSPYIRPDHKPTASGMKGSGAYLEVADTVLAPHYPALWKQVPKNRFEIYLLKQRWGLPPAGIQFECDLDSGSFEGGTTIPYDYDSAGDSFESAMPASKFKPIRKGRRT